MPKSEVMNPFEAVDPEIIDSMKSCTTPYLRSVIIQIITQYPEMADPVKELLVIAILDAALDQVHPMLLVTHLLQVHPRFDITRLITLRAIGCTVDILESFPIVVLRIERDIVLLINFKHIFKPPNFDYSLSSS